MKHINSDLLVQDFLHGTLPVYDAERGQTILYAVNENDKVSIKITKSQKSTALIPLMDLKPIDGLSINPFVFYHKQRQVHPLVNEAICKLVMTAYSIIPAKEEITASNYREAHALAMGAFANRDFPEQDLSGHIALSGWGKHNEFELIDLVLSDQYSYDFDRRTIIVPDLPKDVLVFFAESCHLGVIPIGHDSFGAAILNMNAVAVVNIKGKKND